MDAVSRYWKLITINSAGKRKIKEITSAKKFFFSEFPDIYKENISDKIIQRVLLQILRKSKDNEKSLLAERCLLCFISWQVDKVCQSIATQFGIGNFTSEELLPYVLDKDFSKECMSKEYLNSTSYKSFLENTLQTFDPDRATLASWTSRMVKQNREVNDFLLENGVYLLSDWAILNDTSPKQLERILSGVYTLSVTEIRLNRMLLESYHKVYRQDRKIELSQLRKLKKITKGRLQRPTHEQLKRICQEFSAKTYLSISNEDLLYKLQDLAVRLRKYRIYIRSNYFPIESLDALDNVNLIYLNDSEELLEEQTEFLQYYRELFLNCLDRAISQVIEEKLEKIGRRRNTDKQKQYLTALEQFCCKGLTMSEIAINVGLKAQFQVTRLLRLKELQHDISSEMWKELSTSVLNFAKDDVKLNSYIKNESVIRNLIREQIKLLTNEAKSESKSPKKNYEQKNLFAKRLCHYISKKRVSIKL